jgi:hypothetical protein
MPENMILSAKMYQTYHGRHAKQYAEFAKTQAAHTMIYEKKCKTTKIQEKGEKICTETCKFI